MKQKLISLILALVASMGAWAIDVKIANTSSGLPTAAGFGTFSGQVFTTADGSGLAGVTITADAGVTIGEQNVNVSNYGNCFKIVTSAASTDYKITLAVPDGYAIAGYKLGCSANTKDAVHTLTSEDGSVSVVASAPPYNSPTGPKVFEVTGLNAQSTYFTISTANKGNTLYLPTFTIKVIRANYTNVWNPSIADDMLITACTKVTNGTLNVATAADDNSHWYIMTQVRDGESAMYDNGTQAMRAATTYTPDYFVGKNAVENNAYMIRFIETGTEGIYNIQYANGNFISNTLTSTIEADPVVGNYAVYFTDGASAVAWNLNSKSGSRVDNNGATHTVSFWGSGENTATSGNNIWTLYEATVEVPTVTIEVTYEQYVNGVATGLTYSETALPNSDLNVPANFYSGYNSIAYDFSTEGTIGDADVTIKVNIDAKPGLVEDLANLSNSKAYTIVCPRGTYTVNDGLLANTVKSNYAVNNFAIISYEDNYYLWSIEANKFVACNGNTLGDVPVAITMTSVANGLFKFQGGGKTMNATSGKATGAVFDTWTTTDDGNSCAIIAAADFDPTAVLAAIETFFSTKTINLAVNITGTTEAENTRLGKITMALRDRTVNEYLYADSEESGLLYLDASFTATATSYRGYEFTGFSIGETDYGTSIETGELSAVADGATLVANFTASTGNGLVLWDDYTDDNSASFRIPALVRTQSGRLIAFSDYRPGLKDVGEGACGIERRYSDDGGETWSAALRVADGNWGTNTSSVIEWSFGDAAVVADNTPGNSGNDVLMICCGGNAKWGNSTYNADVSQTQQGCVRWRSTDGGASWSSYEYIQPDLMQAFVDAGLRASDGSSGIVRAFFTSGKITQSTRKAEGASYNRIYSAVVVNGGDVVVYSDDFGTTWTVLGGQIANSGDEAHVVELPDGDILLVGRGNSSRWVNVFNYTDFNAATGSWNATGQWNNAVATACNGDVDVVEAYDAYGDKNTVVIETAPMYGNQRRDLQYYFIGLPKATGFSVSDFSTTGGASWTQGMNVSHNWSAYSALVGNGDGTFDILFEESAKNETVTPKGYSIVYQKGQDIKDITNSQFFFSKTEAQTEGVKTPRPGHFYRIKGSASGAYMTGTSPVTTTTATDATTIWYYSTDGLVSYSTGRYLDGSAKGLAAVGTSYKAAIEASSYHEGKYTVKTNGYYSYDKDTDNTLDRGSSLNDNVRYAWTIEDVTELPVTVSSLGLATFYSPVGLTAPEDVKVYAATLNDTYVHFDEVEAVKAGTGVLVEAAEGTYSFTVESNDANYTSDLMGSVATKARTSIAATVYTLQSGPAFKKFTGENVTGFRSHIETEAGSEVKAFDVIFGDDETGISLTPALSEGEGAIYNLAGQRMSKVQKGINIINGKKILK